jgi:hypothetical protein
MSLSHLMIAVLVLTRAASMLRAADVDLKSLRAEHPRLFLPDLNLAQLQEQLKGNELLSAAYVGLKRDAEKMLAEKPVERVLIGPRLLDKSRTALRRISTLAGLYRLDGDVRFADRAIEEMLAIAKFEDWNPSHFLDVAEMTNAMAIGYDWCFDRLTLEQRTIIRTTIVEKGLKPGLSAFDGKNKGFQWQKSSNNWNQVCCGGLTVGALAVADEEPEIARQILDHARRTIPIALANYAPDGGCEEGSGYWVYASQYTAYFLAALHSALGTDWDLSKSPGLASAGDFRMHVIGPIGQVFNFADARPGEEPASCMMFFAHQFDRPDYAVHELRLVNRKTRGDIFHLFWSLDAWSDARTKLFAQPASPPLDAIFRRINVTMFRSKWNDPNATFVAFKGGDNKAGHSHLDLGSFVLDAQGQRWAIDLGPDDYNLPQYFGAKRFTYYRLRTEGHNTLTIGTDNQATDAKAPIVAFSEKPDAPFAVADLSAAYPDQFKRASRGIKLFGERRSVWLQDDVEPAKPIDLVWQMHTSADVRVDRNAARLKLGDRELIATIVSPQDAKFEVQPVNPPPPQKQDPSVKKLIIRFDQLAAPTRIVVTFVSADVSNAKLPDISPLTDWRDR